MNAEKIEKLREVVDTERVTLINFFRLVNGDLSDIGDALIAGKKIISIVHGQEVITFTLGADRYMIKQERITIGNVSFPKPETVAPCVGTEYYVPDPQGDDNERILSYVWDDDSLDYLWLRNGIIHLSPANAEEHQRAMIKLSGGEV